MKRMGYFIGVGLLLAVLAPAAVARDIVGLDVVGDVHFVRNPKNKDAAGVPPAIFPHWVHLVNFKCFVCHNKTVGFQMKAGSADITMDEIENGKYCGVCHKGKPAFGVSFDTCDRCHRK